MEDHSEIIVPQGVSKSLFSGITPKLVQNMTTHTIPSLGPNGNQKYISYMPMSIGNNNINDCSPLNPPNMFPMHSCDVLFFLRISFFLRKDFK